jgi:glycerophosphoryl diester phosphodiesterase
MHLMVEIKADVYPDPSYQSFVLSSAFADLVPERDFHFLSLDPRMFQYVDFVPAGACIPVAQINLREMSRLSLRSPLGGVAGHYLFVGRACIHRHHAAGQKVGTAYIRSKNSLFREIHRGVDWLFSNHACHIQNIIHRACHS